MHQIYSNTTELQEVLETINNLSSTGITGHTQSADTITAGTFAGAVYAQASSQNPISSLIRNSKILDGAFSIPNPTVNGEIYWIYE